MAADLSGASERRYRVLRSCHAVEPTGFVILLRLHGHGLCAHLRAPLRGGSILGHRAAHEQYNWAATWRIAAIAYVLSGWIPKAQAAIARMREIGPNLRISTYLSITSPFRCSEDRNLCIEALQRAGLLA
ncbi:hypothetical protein [Microvirga splendida]|uniref:Pentatricopeptide repeat-containing protein n=1 Tax=Microvirga splendida TaxID=2795727 RepID=A0ABS0Y7Y7_9HYPH|nr:hypothetical protein [Microvirga splendida]MBJ6128393.1 hypothetical protein [Microvirga splendida]